MQDTYYHSLDAVPLSQIVESEYRIYQLYTLMDRAIPYLQDGLKPCQRRILYTLWKNAGKGLLKVSSATGLVLTLHPHGPASIESSIVNMAQDFTFSNNYPLIDKKGYFGERMETMPAASRYIECKLGEVAHFLLFDDMNQVEMIPNYDEKVMEPKALLPKLPLMLLNGSEGIGTGFSSVIPSFHHADIIDSMVHFVNKGKVKKLKPWVRFYDLSLEIDDKNRIVTQTRIVQEGEDFYITELPKGFDAKRIYKHLNKFIESDYLKDFIDESVDNKIRIQLIFKRGQNPPLEEVEAAVGAQSNIVPNYTLISERGVKVLEEAEQIIEIFTQQRIHVVKRRYELLASECETRLERNSEIIRFINDKHYTRAQKCANRKEFLEYLAEKKFNHGEYLSEMAIYRLTLEEVTKRLDLIKEDTKKLQEYKKVAKNNDLIREKLCEELLEAKAKLTDIFKKREQEKEHQHKLLLKKNSLRKSEDKKGRLKN
jgi:DNA gyrase subunit A